MKVSNLDTPVKQGDNHCFRVQFKCTLVCGKSAWQKLLWAAIVCLWGRINLCFDSHFFFVCIKIKFFGVFSRASLSVKRFAIYIKGLFYILNSIKRFRCIKLGSSVSSNELQPLVQSQMVQGSLHEGLIWSKFVFDKLLVYWPHRDKALPVQLGSVSSVHKWDCEKVWLGVYQSLDVTPVLDINALTVTEAIFTEI